MVLLLLTAAVLCVTLTGVKGVGDFSENYCDLVPLGTEKWSAAVTLSSPLQLSKIVGGEPTFIRDDGLYLEITGTLNVTDNNVCFGIQGTYSGQAPEVALTITAVPQSEVVKTREIRSMRARKAKQIWYVRSVPETTNVDTLLASFKPYYVKWGDDSLSGTKKHSSTPALRVHYAKGSHTKKSSKGGVGWYTKPKGLPNNVDDLVLKYDIYFENFGFGQMGKLPGLYGGVNGEGAFKCSGGKNPSTCFSLRLMWRSGGDGELYAYIPSNQAPGFNKRPDVITNSDYGESIGRGKIRFQNGVWQTVTEQVHLNTIGKTDGWVKICNRVSGGNQQCYTAKNLRMRNSAGHHLRGLFFSTFFGGSSSAPIPPNDCYTYFKELSIEIPDDVVTG